LLGVALALLAMRELWWKPAELPVLGQLPAFSLIDHEGAQFDQQRVRGRVWVASFIYTSCQGPCPLLVERLAQLRRRVAPQQLAIVSFSVDPDTDTVEVLRAYAKAHGIEASQSWWIATGPREQVLGLIRNGFASAVEREEPNDGAEPTASGAILHSTRLMLIDTDGRIRGTYASADPGEIIRLEAEAKDLPSLPSSSRG